MAESVSTLSARVGESGGLLASGGASAVAQTALWLMLVVGLILLLAWLAKRFGGVQFRHHGSVRLLSALPLGNREKIVLVQAGDKYLLLGVTPSQVNTLHVFDELPRDCTATQSGVSGETPDTFQQLLRFALGDRTALSPRQRHSSGNASSGNSL
jgi:flagellar protein FliO/FliZ